MGRVTGSKPSTTKPTSSAPAKSGGFFSSIGNALHKVVYGDEKPGGGLWGEVGTAAKTLSYPVIHPIKFLEGLGEEVNEAIYKPLIGLTGKHKLPVIGDVPSQWDPEFQKSKLTTKGLAEAPGLRMLPFWTVTGDIAQGKMPKLSNVLLDIAAIAGPSAGKGTRLLEGLDVTAQKVGRIALKLPKGEEVVGKLNAGTARLREMLPTRRGPALKAFPEAIRRSEMTVAKSLAEVEDAFRRAGLTEAEELAFRKHYTDRGIRPKDPRLADLYDSVKKWSDEDAAFKLTRELPPEQIPMLKYEIESDFRERLARTKLGPQRTEEMFRAWHAGDVNPFPEFPKEWRGLHRELTKRVVNRTRTARLFKFDPELGREIDPWNPAAELPPQPEGTVRLYRGIGSPMQRGTAPMDVRGREYFGRDAGNWFTNDRAYAENYRARGRSGEMRYVDVPRDVLAEFWEQGNEGPLRTDGVREYVLNKSWADRARPIAEPSIPPQVYPFVQYKTLRSAKFAWKAGKISTETYRDIVASMTPGKYEPLMQMTKATQDFAKFQQGWQTGFGAAAYRDAVREANTSWLDLAEQGVNPVYVPRKAIPTETSVIHEPGPYLKTAKPGELKATTGRAEHYFEGPRVMIRDNAFQLTNQSVTQAAIARVFKETGGASYEHILQDRMRLGYGRAASEQWVRDNFRSINLEGRIGEPVPGTALVRRDVAKGVELYLQRDMPKMVDKLFGMWAVPVMHLAPMFHANNLIGGTALVSLKSHLGPLALVEYGKEALEMVRTGALDPGVPRGVGMAPEFAGAFTKESRIAAGKALWESLRTNIRHPIEFSKRFNNFADTFYKSVQWLDEMDDTLRKGGDYVTARQNANYAASNLMQNWDSFSPFERLVVQRIFPFWGWRKAMMKTVLTYPMDHPFRMHFMAQLARDTNERANLPEEWEDLLAITGEGEDGQKWYLSLRGMDLFGDTADFFSLQGFVQNAHPFLRAAIEATGFDPYIGGTPLFTRKGSADIDPRTGRLRRKMDISEAALGLIPQIQAITGAVANLLEKGVPPPDENTEAGWVKWFDRYGSQLRLIPGLSRRSETEEAERYQKNLKTAESFNRPKESARTPRPRSSGGGRFS